MNERRRSTPAPGGPPPRMSRTRVFLRFLFGAREGVRIAMESIRANPFRSGLTVLGVGIGVCVVVLMAGLITGIRGSIQEGIEAAGPRNFMVMRMDPDDIQFVGDGSTPAWLRRPMLTLAEADRLGRVDGVEDILVSYPIRDPRGEAGGATFRMGSVEVQGVQTTGEGPGWATPRGAELLEGRDFVDAEFIDARTVVIISRRLAEELLGEGPATGARMHIRAGPSGGLPVTVIGVFEPQENPFSDNSAFQAIVPQSTAIRRFKASPSVNELVVVPSEARDQGEVEDAVIAALRTVRGLPPGEPNNFSIVRSTQLLEIFDRFTGVFFIVMIALSSVGLLVGGVGVVGMMLISVTERTREIGIRKALGATRGEILWQFLVEAGVLTLLGGATGLLLGGGFAALVARLTPVPASIPLWAVAVSLAAAAITGMLFGLFPALRAARMAPVEALRHE
ncbi:MAG: ABC transporter permease [Gemmatimonadales bacterium]|nr:MAG: ABC transporter permease [Gemmatimonadales bacterium]